MHFQLSRHPDPRSTSRQAAPSTPRVTLLPMTRSLNRGSQIANTVFISNTTQGWDGSGGGLQIVFGRDITITNSSFQRNTARGPGGGIFIFQPAGAVVIENTTLISNTSNDAGGGVEARLAFNGPALHLDRATFQGNQASSNGAALSVIKQGPDETTVALTNVLLGRNRLNVASPTRAVMDVGGGFGAMVLQMRHLTWANHPGLAALRLSTSDGSLPAMLTNTLIASAASAFVGYEVGSGNVEIQHTNTLTHDVTSLHFTEAGSPSFQAINPLNGNPNLDGTYRLQAGSAAIDAGVDAGVNGDIDGDPRPVGIAPDIGADEFVAARMYLLLVLRAN